MFTQGEIDALVERALKAGLISAAKILDFRSALEKGHIPFFSEAEIRQAASEGVIPAELVEDLIEAVNRPDIAMFDPEAWTHLQMQRYMSWGIPKCRH